MEIGLGDLSISALMIIKSMISLAILLWLASFSSRLLEQRIKAMPSVTPTMQVLLTKILKIALVIIAIVAAVSIVGIDLTAFAVFSGAVGVGVGLGLQKSISNLFTGILILMDKSVKPGDVIEVGETYGTINSLGGRYVSVITRDGIEHLIPNEEMVTQRVANWTRTNSNIRVRLPIGVDYSTDLPKALDLCASAATRVERVLPNPVPICLTKNFGDSSIDLELRIWINDPQNGIANVSSDIYLEIWNSFKENGIQLPFPQRDIHLKTIPQDSIQNLLKNAAPGID
jgi:small-conductance mechanosensitive channel